MLRKGHDGLYKAPSKEGRGKRRAKRSERDLIKFSDLRYEIWQVVRFKKARRRQEFPQIMWNHPSVWKTRIVRKLDMLTAQLHIHFSCCK